MDPLTNECQQLAIEVFAQHGAPNTPATMAAARVIGDAFAKKIKEGMKQRIAEEQKAPIGGNDFLSKEYAEQQFKRILPGYEVSPRGVFEDLFSVLRQDAFLLRSLSLIGSQTEAEQIDKVKSTLKSLSTWVTSFSQYRKTMEKS